MITIDNENFNSFFHSFEMPWRSDAVMEVRYSKLSIERVGIEGLSRAAQNHARQPRPTSLGNTVGKRTTSGGSANR
jgi:hypothetical protein